MCDYPTYRRFVSGYVVVLLARHIDISDKIRRSGLFCGGGELTFPLRIDKVESNVALHEMERTESQMAVLALGFRAHFLCSVWVINP
ncbi:hypothetical protein OUZ56_020391 [Daphnia magna]|uniref:Uncharacterized protein n=1 Tax=Daphnia magna TaxID=35525 RepID=A0ABQ9ZEC6_9CRUS|nr:hypothetical protein OUZ56_020391 [Daphnia magna]